MEHSIKGRLVVHRNNPREARCVCCTPKPHAFGWGIKVPRTARSYPGLKVEGLSDWIHDRLSDWIDKVGDKANVTVTIKIEK